MTTLLQDEITEIEARLGRAERARMELHRQAIQQIELRLGMTGGGGGSSACGAQTMPADSTSVLTNDHIHLDTIVSAFACDITRVAGIHYGNDQVIPVDLPDLTGNQHSDFIHSGDQDG